MKKKVFVIADYFIAKNNKEKVGLTNKKLQKLLYYAQAWNLVLNGKRLFSDDIQAWVHGPAVPAVYEAFKGNGSANIALSVDEGEFEDLTLKEKSILDDVWAVYGKYDADYLEVLSHSEEPWKMARNGMAPYEASKSIISEASMKDFYGRQISK